MFKGNRNAKTMEANDLARTMTDYVGKGTTTHRCVSHTSKLYAVVHSITFGEQDDLHMTFHFSNTLARGSGFRVRVNR